MQILLSISILPVILLAMFIYFKDKNKEPISLLLSLFFSGLASIVITIVLSIISEIMFPILAIEETETSIIKLLISAFIGVALIEEFSKWIMIYLISYKNKNFDEFYDMVEYATFVGLGFACFENIMYVLGYGLGTGIIRAFTAVPSHCCFGIFMGYYLGMSKIAELNNRKDIKNKNIVKSIIVPMTLHGIYDFCLFAPGAITIITWLIFIVTMYTIAIIKINKVSNINKKIKYKNNFCMRCGRKIDSNYCPVCGNKNE